MMERRELMEKGMGLCHEGTLGTPKARNPRAPKREKEEEGERVDVSVVWIMIWAKRSESCKRRKHSP